MSQQINPEVQIMQNLNELSSTVMVLEDRYRNLRKKIKVTDSNLLDAERNLSKEMQVLNEEMVELKAKITKISEKIGQAFEDSKNLVKRHEFLELKKYVDLWNPMDFITVKEVREMAQNLNKDAPEKNSMALFEQNPAGNQQMTLPTEQVRQMRAQGMDNNRIINSLQADGFSTSQIFDAMSMADEGKVPADLTSSRPPNGFEPQPVDFQQPITHNGPSDLNPSNEELIEAIIDEKWNELVDDINKIIDWKNRAESRLSSIETSLKNLRNEFNNLHQGVLGRVSSYDKNLLNVGAELKAMESMFTKVLPNFMENVQKLDNIAVKFDSKKRTN